MGVNQSHSKGESWSDENQWRTYTLPRTGPRIYRNAPAHPDDKDFSCELLGIRPRISRSQSLDEGRGVSPWAIHHLQCVDDQYNKPLQWALTPTPLPTRKLENNGQKGDSDCEENVEPKCKILGKPEVDYSYNASSNPVIQSICDNVILNTLEIHDSVLKNEDCLKVQNTSDIDNDILLKDENDPNFPDIIDEEVESLTKKSNNLSSTDISKTSSPSFVLSSVTDHSEVQIIGVDEVDYLNKNSINISSSDISKTSSTTLVPSSETDCKLPVIPIDVQEGCDNKWPSEDEDDTCISDYKFNEDNCYPCYTKSNSLDALEHNRHLDHNYDYSDSKEQIKTNRGRKSEPSLSGSFLAIPLIQDGRRHTLPSPRAGGGSYSFLAPPTPLFDTTSWETLPPADELEVQLENKPISCSIAENESFTSVFSKSRDSSLSDVSFVTNEGSTNSTMRSDEFILVSPYRCEINNLNKYKSKTCSLPVEMRYIYSEPQNVPLKDSISSASTTILESPLSSTPNASAKYNSYSNETFAPTPVVIRKTDNCNIVGLIPKKTKNYMDINDQQPTEIDKLNVESLVLEDDSNGASSTCLGFNDPTPLCQGKTSTSSTISDATLCSTNSNNITSSVVDATTQTALSDKPCQYSRLSSLIWLSDERLNREPCESSLNLSYSEDDYSEYVEERDTSDDEMESSSSPAATSASFSIHDSSLSLSESLDALDVLGESEFGNSPPNHYLQNYKGNNLELLNFREDLETSFQHQINRYINDQSSCDCDYGNICNPISNSKFQEHWTRLEDRSTQTDPEQTPSVVLSECSGYLLDTGFEHNNILEMIQKSKIMQEHHLDERVQMGKERNYLHLPHTALPLHITKGAVVKTHSDPEKSSYYGSQVDHGSQRATDKYYSSRYLSHLSAQDLALPGSTAAVIQRSGKFIIHTHIYK
ncbi:unnamed protein product [Meganyctiphanes norvegica]|uniref:Uncharacterized protein n=1 Tax=Meganyctiphanes norvegica TaxID=48144 RepID=A0AAV2RHB1_MEGNR